MSTTTTNTDLIVTAGPSDMELAIAFIYAFDKRHTDFMVDFTGRIDGDDTEFTFQATVFNLSYESGTRGMLIVELSILTESGKRRTVQGFYNANSRKGHFRPSGFDINTVV